MLKLEIIDKYFFHFQPGAHHRVRGKQVCRIIDNIYIYISFIFNGERFEKQQECRAKEKKEKKRFTNRLT